MNSVIGSGIRNLPVRVTFLCYIRFQLLECKPTYGKCQILTAQIFIYW